MLPMYQFSHRLLNAFKTKGHLVFSIGFLLCPCHFCFGQSDSIPADTLINRGHNYVKKGEPQKAFETFFDALSRFDKRKETQDYFDVLTALTFHLYYTDTYGEYYPLDQRLQYIDEAIGMAIDLEEDSIYTNKIYHKGVLFNINESIDSALYYFDNTIESANSIGNDNILLQAYYFKSGLLRDMGDLNSAYQLLVEYEKEAQRIEHPVHIQTVLEALAAFYVTTGEPEKSLFYYKRSLETARQYKMDAYYSLTSLATSYMDFDSLDQARKLLNEADLEIDRVMAEDDADQQHDFKRMSLKMTQGYFYAKKLSDFDSALLYFRQGLEMAQMLNHKESIAETTENIAQVYDKTGKPDKALETRLENYELAQEVVNLKLMIQIEKSMALNYEALNQDSEALSHYKTYHTLSDSLLNFDQLNAVAALETEFNTKKKEQQIALLNEQTKRQNARQNGFIIIGVLLSIVLVVVFLALRSKQKANRLISIQKDALIEGNLKLLELSEFKENLTHMIVHDMKNPLNAVIGLSKGEPTQKKLHTIGQSGQQMLNMVSNMLDVQKFEEAKVSLNTEAHSFHTLFREASIQLELLMHAKNIQVSVEIDKRVSVEVDSELVVRIIGNLLSNAVKFSSLGGLIKVSTQINEQEELAIAITDHGPGLQPEQVKQVFDKYWQDAKQVGYGSSTGLGLTFCKLAVEAHGGRISVSSTPGHHTTFSFTLPIAHISEAVEDAEAETLEREESLILESDIAVLSKYIPELGSLKVHQVGKINQIIRQMDKEEITSPWKNNLISAMHQGNQARFDELVEMLR